MNKPFDFVVFSHLRWDFVFQRPQHLLSRFARQHRVIFVEEPMITEGKPYWEFRDTGSNVIVCRPHTNIDQGGFNDAQLSEIHRLMPDLIGKLDLRRYVAWFYTPMALPLLNDIAPSVVIYDCMDELSAFLGAPKELLDREERLLKMADLVFTGGPSLYRAKQHRNPNVFCFPSSVDSKHYSKAKPGGAGQAEDQAHLPGPRMGYFGVIDERIDLGLIERMARTRPEWQICMVGPVVKIDPASLPNSANITWFGQRQYAELPSYLAGWDVCMLPFALNKSTKFISPTKTLEYMAAERMIVSTPITDVAEPYGKIVYIARGAEEFVAACDRAMKVGTAERIERVSAMREVLSKTSWDNTAKAMLNQILKAMGISGTETGTIPLVASATAVSDRRVLGD